MGGINQKLRKGVNVLRLIVGILVVLWLIGLLAHVAGGLIYILLVIAAIVLVYDVIVRGKSA
jgi:4-hydroxybenzoate polyprenyltransferase